MIGELAIHPHFAPDQSPSEIDPTFQTLDYLKHDA
jgi:hypothetical protein